MDGTRWALTICRFTLGKLFLLLSKICLLWKIWPISVIWWKLVWIRAWIDLRFVCPVYSTIKNRETISLNCPSPTPNQKILQFDHRPFLSSYVTFKYSVKAHATSDTKNYLRPCRTNYPHILILFIYIVFRINKYVTGTMTLSQEQL